MQTFRLAPMTRDLQALTTVILLVPVGVAVALQRAASPVRPELYGALGLILVLYATVWLWWRPRRFEVSALGLAIVWPLRRRTIVAAHLGPATTIDRRSLWQQYGRGMRLGAGGLWGGFGLLVTPKQTFAMYVSRTDAFVLVPVSGARTLMLTPERPMAFVTALQGLRRRP
jgi:hypothetical protein